MAPTTPSSLISCNNPACSAYNVINRDSLLKCGKCKTITYCNKECQRAHWPVHKQICKVWQDTASMTSNGEGVREFKKKMGEFLYLIRGVPDYVDDLFKEYLASTREGRRGCIEFLFATFDELVEAVLVLRNLPVVGEHILRTMPGAPGHEENPEGIPITLRKRTTKRERTFIKAVDTKMAFIESHPQTRPNLVHLLRMVGSSERSLVVCVTMRLKGPNTTSSYDFLFRDLDWSPEDVPLPERLAIQGPGDSPPLRHKISFDMD
ncbi:hypothetical protein DFH09DRAFT_174840 [Mycena vulgaris]|nr:hypothetical protein DFH09DRAFT_174840 [Mycena vulgaris]